VEVLIICVIIPLLLLTKIIMMPTEQSFFQRNKTWLIILGLVVVLAFWVMGSYNSLITQDKAVTAQWAQVDNQLQRRFDLIPNVVETVKGEMKQETAVFTAIAEARTRYSGATTVDQKAAAASQYESAIGRLLVISENYPVLGSSKGFSELRTQLEGAENRIAVERMKYNQLVQAFDTSISRFPGILVAKMFGFGEKSYFEVPETAKVNPEVKF